MITKDDVDEAVIPEVSDTAAAEASKSKRAKDKLEKEIARQMKLNANHDEQNHGKTDGKEGAKKQNTNKGKRVNKPRDEAATPSRRETGNSKENSAHKEGVAKV